MNKTLDWMGSKEWFKLHRFVQKVEDKVKKPIIEKEFTAPGQVINIIKNKVPVATITRFGGRVDEVRVVTIPDKSVDNLEVSSGKVELAEKIYRKLKEEWKNYVREINNE